MLAPTLPPKIEARLDDLARETGRDKEEIATEALLEYIDDLEDLHIAQKRIEDLKNAKDHTVALAEMLKRYDVDV